MAHDEFVRLYRAGQIAVLIEDGTARKLVEEHPAMPKRSHNAHALWTWVWMLTGLISCGLIPMLFGIRHAINKSAREFVVELALENRDFYEEVASKKWLVVEARR